jgi:hypothetical protein
VTRFLPHEQSGGWLFYCTCSYCQRIRPLQFRSLQATFFAVSKANKTLDKPAETCQG